ncbi:hypothetical protein B0T14DRAFT_515596 [Immersiella caudata]|uniref:RNase MRP protein 1 RNA binding domain-containing protein n=1 Tax=Immersiella caudata TaxID=314043 RepID=A0AA39WX54_9PEZI|nr:hypothetical protein B0T14DRAFT_515596 [Immersiella caudata]
MLGRGCYLSFTQLTADRQFAHLGLMLLGVLAQVEKAVSVYAPVESGKGMEGEAMQIYKGVSIPDVGIPISRDTMGLPVERSEYPLPARQPGDQPRETVEISSPKDADRPKTKKKKKASEGDEFDDIFGGLEKTSKRPKKKRKKGDEFDDIFNGL